MYIFRCGLQIIIYLNILVGLNINGEGVLQAYHIEIRALLTLVNNGGLTSLPHGSLEHCQQMCSSSVRVGTRSRVAIMERCRVVRVPVAYIK